MHPEVQVKLRNEIQAMHNEMTANGQSELTADDIAKMPYMDAVVVGTSSSIVITDCVRNTDTSCDSEKHSDMHRLFI